MNTVLLGHRLAVVPQDHSSSLNNARVNLLLGLDLLRKACLVDKSHTHTHTPPLGVAVFPLHVLPEHLQNS